MNAHQKAYDALNESVKSLAVAGGEPQRKLMVVCRDYLTALSRPDFCDGLYLNFQLVSKKLGIESHEFNDVTMNLKDKEAENLIKEICNLQLQVCEEYFTPGSY